MDKLDLLLDKLGVMIDKFNIIVEQKETPKCDKTLNEWIVDWLNLYKEGKVKPSTLYMYKSLIKNYISKAIGYERLADLDTIRLQRFVNSIEYSRQREKVYCTLKNCFTCAVNVGYLSANPMLSVEVKKCKPKESVSLTAEQEKWFVRSAERNKHCDLFMIMLYAGLRRGEALALLESDIDLVEKRIRVNKTIDGFNKVGTPKTEKSIRSVPILPELLPYVKKYIGGRDVFIHRMTDTVVQRHFTKIIENAGLRGKGITIHSLRHTFATRCAEKGVPPKVVQKWLGHSTFDMTMGIYTHVNDDYEEKIIRQLENEKLSR